MRLEPARALLNNPPFISAKIPSHIWDFFFPLLPWEPPQISQLLRPPTVSMDRSVWFCQLAQPLETYGAAQEAGCIALIFSPPVRVRQMEEKTKLPVLAQKAENEPWGLPEALSL